MGITMNFIKTAFKSIFIGVGSIAPGVSGGALAIVFGLYEKIIYSINNLLSDIKTNGTFLMSVGLGAGIGVVIFSSIQLTLIENYEMQAMFVFAGLVVGTLPTLFKKANEKGYSQQFLIPFFITLALGLLFTYLNQTSISDNVQDRDVVMNFKNIMYLFLIGFIMSGSLVIPGISGTVLLFLLGVYGLIINAVASVKDVLLLPFGTKQMFFEFFDKMYILIPLGLGLAVGVIAFSKLMEYLLKEHYSYTYYAILGFVIGSIPELIPGFNFGPTGILSLILFLVSLLVSLQINRMVKE